MNVYCPIASRHALRTAASTLTKRERATFNCKSAHILNRRGYANSDIAKILDISERSVRAYVAGPCLDLYAEQMADASRIKSIEQRRDAFASGSFCQSDDFLSEGETLRNEIYDMRSQGMRDAEIARHFGISRQRVQYYTGRTRDRHGRDRPPASMEYALTCESYTLTMLALLVACMTYPHSRGWQNVTDATGAKRDYTIKIK